MDYSELYFPGMMNVSAAQMGWESGPQEIQQIHFTGKAKIKQLLGSFYQVIHSLVTDLNRQSLK